MKALLRADGGAEQGTGHVMRCLTLAESLRARGHDVILLTSEIDVPWLERAVILSGIPVVRCQADTIPRDVVRALRPDRVVVDSYLISADDVNELARDIAVLALVDGDERGLDVQLYLDQNLGAERHDRDPARYLYGAEFALVRDEVLAYRRPNPWKIASRPRVLSFMGGSDPTHTSVAVAEALAEMQELIDITMVVPEPDHAKVRAAFSAETSPIVLAPTTRLPELLGSADIVIAAAGTSAWDVCALAIPAILVAVVDNQKAGFDEAVSRGLTLGIDARAGSAPLRPELGTLLGRLLVSESDRARLSRKCGQTIDGNGKLRAVQHLESVDRGKDVRS